MDESTRRCRLCPRTMPAAHLAGHLARHHPDSSGAADYLEAEASR